MQFLSHHCPLAIVLSMLVACGAANDPQSRVQRAEEYLANGEFRASMIELKNALQEDPDNIDARVLLGEVSIAMGQTEAAASEFQKAAGLGAAESRIRMPLGEALLAQRAFDAILSRFTISAGDPAVDKLEIHQLRGRAQLGLGNMTAARSEFEQALQIKPGESKSILGLAAIASTAGDTVSAEELIEQALASTPGLVEAWLAKGQLYMQKGDYALAEEAIQAGLDRAQTAAETQLALVGLTEVQIAQNRMSEAAQSLDRLTSMSPNNMLTSYLRARVAAASGDYQAAVSQLQQILADFPMHIPSRLLFGVVSFAQGNLATAESYLQSALAADPQNLEARKLLAEIRLRMNRPADVLDVLRSPADQQDPAILTLSARARLALDDAEAASADLEHGVQSNPDNEDLRIKLAASYLLANRQPDAARVLQDWPASAAASIRRDLLLFLGSIQSGEIQHARSQAEQLSKQLPGNADLSYLIGSGFTAAGDLETATSYFTETLQSDDDHLPAMLAMAQLSELDGDGPLMLAWLQRATASDPSAPEPRLRLARYYVMTADFQHAEELAEPLVQSSPDDPLALEILGLAQLGRGRYADAGRNLGNAIRLRPDAIETYVELAVSQMALNDVAGATQTLEKAIEVQPDHLQATAMLASLTIRSGDLQQADAMIDHLLALDEVSALPYTLRGDVLTARHEDAAAARAYGRAAELSNSRGLAIRYFNAMQRAGEAEPTAPLSAWLVEYPDDSAVRLILAQAHQSAGQNIAARHQYELLLQQNGTHAVALNNLAWLSHEEGRSDAVDLAARAYASSPDSGAVADTYGWMLMQSGDLEKAEAMLRLAARKEPDIGEIRFHLAACLALSGAEAEASQLLSELVNSGETFASLSQAMEMLESLKP